MERLIKKNTHTNKQRTTLLCKLLKIFHFIQKERTDLCAQVNVYIEEIIKQNQKNCLH